MNPEQRSPMPPLREILQEARKHRVVIKVALSEPNPDDGARVE